MTCCGFKGVDGGCSSTPLFCIVNRPWLIFFNEILVLFLQKKKNKNKAFSFAQTNGNALIITKLHFTCDFPSNSAGYNSSLKKGKKRKRKKKAGYNSH